MVCSKSGGEACPVCGKYTGAMQGERGAAAWDGGLFLGVLGEGEAVWEPAQQAEHRRLVSQGLHVFYRVGAPRSEVGFCPLTGRVAQIVIAGP